MSYLRRQLVTAALTANAIRPVPGFRLGIPAFFAGWLTGELTPHLLAVTAADTAAHVVRRGPTSRAGLALAGASTLGMAFLLDQARRVRTTAEDALVEGLGLDYVEQLDAKPTPAELATPWRRLVNPFRMKDLRVRVDKDVPYAPDLGKRGLLDVYRPAEGDLTGAPVLLQVHGGGWSIGKKDEQAIPLMQHLAAKGWVCIAINYRLSPRDAFPAHVVDVKRAIAWIRDHVEEYGGDPGYLAITGGSAGGHLCALAALTPHDPAFQPGFEDADTTVQCAVPHYGVYDFAGSTGLRSAELMR
ncbi:MAG: alpha/beta hydrolase, partial [Nocardioides sp.]